MNFKKGFILIKILLVITVIILLATIVFIIFEITQDKAKDARIKSSLAQLRNIAELSATLEDYTDVCDRIKSTTAYLDLSNMGGSNVECNNNEEGYCVQVTLKGGTSICTSGNEILENADCGGNHICDYLNL